jgi:peptidoglycan/LPS O-acetylase OafA/YrhL
MPLQLQAGIHDLFIQTTPYGINRQESIIYGSLWTLPYEVKFYCLLFIFYLIGRNYTLYIFSGLFLFFFWVSIRNAIDPSFNFVVNVNYAGHFNRWLFVFLSGCILGLSASRIKQNSIIRKILAALGALLIFSYFIFPTLHQILELCAYALSPWFILFFLKSSILNRASICDFDISFGVYIFGFAVQQSLAALGWNSNFGLYLTSSILLTFLLAFFSWIFIERPFLNRRRIKLANT